MHIFSNCYQDNLDWMIYKYVVTTLRTYHIMMIILVWKNRIRERARERERLEMKRDFSHHHEWKVDAKLQANAIQRLRPFMSSIKNMYNHS